MYNLHQKLARGSASGKWSVVVGWRGAAPVSVEQFASEVSGWETSFAQLQHQNIALYFDDSIEFAAALFGAWRAQKTVYLTADVLESNCQNLSKDVHIFVGEFPEKYRTKLPALRVSVENQNIQDYLPRLDDDFPALVVYTSGSTGEAQAIPKKWSQLAAEVETLENLFGVRMTDSKIFSTVSHHHIYGLLFKVLWPFSSGRPISAAAINYPEQLQELLAREDCVLVASPAHLKRIPEHLDWSGVKTHLKVVFSSGGPLSDEALLSVQRLWSLSPIEVYGSSETGGIAWRQRLEPKDQAWSIFPNVEWRRAEQDQTIEIRSPHLPSPTWEPLADRIEAIDTEHFRLLGRQDRIVKIEEKRISLDLMERVLLADSLVVDARLIVIDRENAKEPSKFQRQQIVAFVVLSAEGRSYLSAHGKFSLNQTLRMALAKHVEAVALPRRWRYLESMPINAQGKTTQAQLLALVATMDNSALPTKPRCEIIEQESLRQLLRIIVPADLLYFRGHFPIAPVLPGVVQVDWALHFAREFFGLAKKFRGLSGLKFQQIIGPETPVYLELVYKPDKHALQFKYFSDVGQHATGTALFAQD